MKTIKSQIIVTLLSFVVILCLLFGFLGCYLNYTTAMKALEMNLPITAETASKAISSAISAVQNVIVATGVNSIIYDPYTSPGNKKQFLNDQEAIYGFSHGSCVDNNGNNNFGPGSVAEEEFFKVAVAGKPYISTPVIDKITEKISFIISAPIWENGSINSNVIGVIYFSLAEDFLSKVIEDINISKTGFTYILDKNGTNLAGTDPTVVCVENSIRDAEADSSLKQIAAVEMLMIEGQMGFATYAKGGAEWVQGYAPIPNTDGWSVGVTAEKNDFIGGFYVCLIITFILVIVFVTAGAIKAFKFGNRIGNPIRECSERLKLLAEGDLNAPCPEFTGEDEIGILASSTEIVIETLRSMVGDVSHELVEISKGNLNLPKLDDYQGDFAPMSTASNEIVASLNSIILNINRSAAEVSGGSEQVSAGAQALSAGATRQAEAIEELSATVNNISNHITQNVKETEKANDAARVTSEKLGLSSIEMDKMVDAMANINNTSRQISNIIKTINDIAFQTNILAINASVEAAHAGEAGKGFSVVAAEVRNLAAKSAQAVEETTTLIEDSLNAVALGRTTANKTAKILNEVIDESVKTTQVMSAIAKNSEGEARSISEVTVGIDQISTVIQTNSATAEQSAASAEQLSGQAGILKNLVKKFIIRDDIDEISNYVSQFASGSDFVFDEDGDVQVPQEDDDKYTGIGSEVDVADIIHLSTDDEPLEIDETVSFDTIASEADDDVQFTNIDGSYTDIKPGVESDGRLPSDKNKVKVDSGKKGDKHVIGNIYAKSKDKAKGFINEHVKPIGKKSNTTHDDTDNTKK